MAFEKGKSGNPGGRPKAAFRVQELAREQTDKAIQTLVEICSNPEAAPASRVAAASALLDRGYGKPMQPSEITGGDGSPLLDGIKIVLARPNDRG